MSLEQTTEKKQTKKARARELALKYKDLPYDEARTKIREEVPCSRSTATKALQWFRGEQEKEAAAKPAIEVTEEEKKEAPFIGEKPRLEEIAPTEAPPAEEIRPEEEKKQLEVFKDMLRGMHVMIISEEGLLGEKYGRKKEQCIQASDQLYRWLTRRYGVEDLERYDTILLILSYGTLVGGILKDVVAERRKKPSTSKKS